MGHYTLLKKLLSKLTVRSTRLRTGLFLSTAIVFAACADDVTRNEDLARRLANDSTRDSAVAHVAAAGASSLPHLLSWAEKPPAGIDRDELDIGLADAFARLRAKEAIPFLIKNLSLNRDGGISPWLKSSERIEDTYPMAAALIAIGPDACEALVAASKQPMGWEDRLVAIFVVTQVISRGGYFPGARGVSYVGPRPSERGAALGARRTPAPRPGAALTAERGSRLCTEGNDYVAYTYLPAFVQAIENAFKETPTQRLIRCNQQYFQRLLNCESAYPPGPDRQACYAAAKAKYNTCIGIGVNFHPVHLQPDIECCVSRLGSAGYRP